MSSRAGRFVAAAFLAACLYALSTPCSKVLLANVAPNMMAALLYLGAGVGMAALTAARAAVGRGPSAEAPLERADAPYVAAMVLLDVAAPILLMAGLSHAAPENVALLNNFEIVATAVIALRAFQERVAARTWAGIAVITVSCALLSLEGEAALSFSSGSLLVLGACLCWGVENNCTSRLSQRDPAQVVIVKGLGSGAGALAVALVAGDALPAPPDALAALLLGDLQRQLQALADAGSHAALAVVELGHLLAAGVDYQLVGGLIGGSLVVQLHVVEIHRVAPADHQHHRGHRHQDQDKEQAEQKHFLRFHAFSSCFWASASRWPALLRARRFLAAYITRAMAITP